MAVGGAVPAMATIGWSSHVSHWRRRSGVVRAVLGDGGMVIYFADDDVQTIAAADVWCVVRAGAITRANELRGPELKGTRVRVFWPEDDACFDGCVVEYREGLHVVHYDDGEVREEVLGSVDTPHYRVLD